MRFLIAHLIGDFLLQNDWMQAKTRSWPHACIHVAYYMVPFLFCGLPWLAFALIAGEHLVQDRYRLGGVWSRLMRQTPPEKWPQGALWVDQALHAAWMAGVIHWLA